MRKRQKTFGVTRNGIDIRLVNIKGGVDPKIDYSLAFEEWEAASAAGLDLYKWDNGEYPVKFQAKVIAWKRLHDLVHVHREVAAQEKAGKK